MAGSTPASRATREAIMYQRKDRVVFRSTKTRDPNVKWVRKTGSILEITVIDGHTSYNIHVDGEGTIEPVLLNAVESKT